LELLWPAVLQVAGFYSSRARHPKQTVALQDWMYLLG
jgi:hypothetical protein